MGYISTLAIQQALDNVVLALPDMPVFYEENMYAHQDGVISFMRSTLGPAKTTILTIGSDPILEQQGIYQVDVFTPVAYGYLKGRTVADAVINAFPPGFVTLSDGNRLIIHTAWSSPAINDQSSFFMIPVSVEYHIRTAV